ncbi:hypothetical protein DIPPA_14811 [Diplonema papillatum]|nr:hypothetical protein DIPPA_14811 [Diplonema papillatum]
MAENQQQQQVLPFWNSRCPTSGGALHRKWKLLARACFLEDRSLYCWTAGTVAAFAARLAAAASDAVGYRQFADALRAATNERSAEISAQRRIPLRQVPTWSGLLVSSPKLPDTSPKLPETPRYSARFLGEKVELPVGGQVYRLVVEWTDGWMGVGRSVDG